MRTGPGLLAWKATDGDDLTWTRQYFCWTSVMVWSWGDQGSSFPVLLSAGYGGGFEGCKTFKGMKPGQWMWAIRTNLWRWYTSVVLAHPSWRDTFGQQQMGSLSLLCHGRLRILIEWSRTHLSSIRSHLPLRCKTLQISCAFSLCIYGWLLFFLNFLKCFI